MFVDDYVSRYIEITGDTLVSDEADTALFSKLDPESDGQAPAQATQ